MEIKPYPCPSSSGTAVWPGKSWVEEGQLWGPRDPYRKLGQHVPWSADMLQQQPEGPRWPEVPNI